MWQWGRTQGQRSSGTCTRKPTTVGSTPDPYEIGISWMRSLIGIRRRATRPPSTHERLSSPTQNGAGLSEAELEAAKLSMSFMTNDEVVTGLRKVMALLPDKAWDMDMVTIDSLIDRLEAALSDIERLELELIIMRGTEI